MARFQDWVDLTGTTIRSIGSNDVAGLYEREWPAVRKKLLEEHLQSIQQDPKRWRRWLRTGSALMYGLTKRLVPERRILFLLAILVGVLSFSYLGFHSSASSNEAKTVASLFIAFVILVFLLALELIDKLRFRDELELARDLQSSLLPKEMPDVPGLELFAYNRIANTVGGDLYDFAPLPDGRLAMLFGDASGHGMAAGLVMAVAQAAFRTQLEVSAEPEPMLSTLNRLLCRTGGSRSFFSACYLVLEPAGQFRVAVAGHPPILHFSGAGSLKRHIGSSSYPLGIKTGLTWPSERGSLEPGETLLFCSDGIPESMNRSGEVFGYDRLVETAQRHAAAPDLGQRLLADWQLFMGGAIAEDDVSVTTVRRVGSEGV